MKLAVSNIAWEAGQDEAVYDMMEKYGIMGLEIAPTRIFPENPYDDLGKAKEWAARLTDAHGFLIPSMQSIWFGRQQKLFGSVEEREELAAYTKKAIDFAVAVGCRNLVFGCPRNRYLPQGADPQDAVGFFREIGGYAKETGTVIGIEANPPIYGTNYMNDTESALDVIREVASKGAMLNLDVGTMVQNGEDASVLAGNVHLVSHVHVSEPGLAPIRERALHQEIKGMLEEGHYHGFVSVEMGKADDMRVLEERLRYIKDVFG